MIVCFMSAFFLKHLTFTNLKEFFHSQSHNINQYRNGNKLVRIAGVFYMVLCLWLDERRKASEPLTSDPHVTYKVSND